MPEPDAGTTPFRAAKTDPLWQRAIPVAKELPGYRLFFADASYVKSRVQEALAAM